MTEQKLFTESALSDKIKEFWKNKKIPGYYAGDYYYEIIDQGILFNKEIEIPLEHLDNELREILNKTGPKTIQYVIFRAIKEIAQEKFGSCDFENRIKWKFV